MGGTRCHFRKCHVNTTKFPLIHFFRFPLKEPERYKKWRQCAKMEHMLDFTMVRRKNTSVCARHFRIECFMNYKMDRLAPNAVPTLNRLTNELALDYELDVENGVLVRLENTKQKHLIAPDNFESPLHLENDQVLLEMLNELQSQQGDGNIEEADNLEYVVGGNTTEYEMVVKEKPVKSLVNYVEILETIQVTAPHLKRSREMLEDDVQDLGAGVSNKKCRIIKTTNCEPEYVKNTTTLERELDCEEVNNDDIDYVPTDEIENMTQLVNADGPLMLAGNDFIHSNYVDDEDDDVEFVEIHRNENNFHYDLPSNESGSTIVQLKSRRQEEDTSMTHALNKELLKVQQELSELKKKTEDFNVLQIKLSILETENSELKETRKENEKMKNKLLTMQMENNCFKRTLKENKTLKDKLQEYCKENKKLKLEATSTAILRAELVSRQQETKELKKILESLKSSQQKQQELEKINSDLENERSKILANEQKLQDEISVLKRNSELSKKQLSATELKLKEAKTDLNSMANEKDRLKQRIQHLEESLDNIQNNFDVKQNDYSLLKTGYDNLQQKYSGLEQKHWKLQALQNQEATVTTSITNTNKILTPPSSVNTLTKSQLFNGIKRYVSASMVTLLRMEMFGSSEREWKCDERQIAVDILRLGETVYKYFTDEWRFRLPSLRDVRNWLSQSQQLMDDEEDL